MTLDKYTIKAQEAVQAGVQAAQAAQQQSVAHTFAERNLGEGARYYAFHFPKAWCECASYRHGVAE